MENLMSIPALDSEIFQDSTRCLASNGASFGLKSDDTGNGV